MKTPKKSPAPTGNPLSEDLAALVAETEKLFAELDLDDELAKLAAKEDA